ERGSAAVRLRGPPPSPSKSPRPVDHGLPGLASRGAPPRLVHLAPLPAEPLLGRGTRPPVTAALEAASRAGIVVAGTPVYRATYSGLIKLCFDLLPQDSRLGKVGVPIVTGHGAAHSLAVDHGLRPLFASLGATVVASGVYATSSQFPDGKPGPELLRAVDQAVHEALALATAGLRGPVPPGTCATLA